MRSNSVSSRFQARNPVAQIGQLTLCDVMRAVQVVSARTLKRQQRLNVNQGQSKVPGVADEAQPPQSCLIIPALISGGALGPGHQPLVLVKPDCRYFNAGLAGQISD